MIRRLAGAVALVALSGAIAIANVDAVSSLGSPEPYLVIADVAITTKHALATLAVAIDLLMVAALFAVAWAWSRRRFVQAIFATVVWAVCAGASWHSIWLWINTNLAAVQAPAAQSQAVNDADRDALATAAKKAQWLLALDVSKQSKRDRARHLDKIEAAQKEVAELRRRVASAPIKIAPSPIEGFEWLAASVLILLHAIGPFAIFGSGHPDVRTARQRAGGGGVPAAMPAESVAVPAVMPPGLPPAMPAEMPPEMPAVVPPPMPPKPPNKINGVTPMPPTHASGGVPAAGTPMPPPRATAPVPPEPPAGTPPMPAVMPAAVPVANIFSLDDAVVPAVRRWLRTHTDKDAAGFLSTSEAWDSYCRSGGPDIPKDDFFKALKVVLGDKAAGRRKSIRGYNGIALRSEAGASALTT